MDWRLVIVAFLALVFGAAVYIGLREAAEDDRHRAEPWIEENRR